jgi:hypothetical protein
MCHASAPHTVSRVTCCGSHRPIRLSGAGRACRLQLFDISVWRPVLRHFPGPIPRTAATVPTRPSVVPDLRRLDSAGRTAEGVAEPAARRASRRRHLELFEISARMAASGTPAAALRWYRAVQPAPPMPGPAGLWLVLWPRATAERMSAAAATRDARRFDTW